MNSSRRTSAAGANLLFSPTSVVIGFICASIGGYLILNTRSKQHRDPLEEEEDEDAFLTYQPYEPHHTFWRDMRVLKAMGLDKISGEDLQSRLDSFYDTQADLYDGYRFRMLHGRPKVLRGVARHVSPAGDSSRGITWVDLACGTGANAENFATSLLDGRIERAYLVDLCRPMCRVARRERGEKYGNDKVRVIHGDVTDDTLEGLPPAGTVDLVTISYALVMIPDWRKCIANAKRLLRKGGIIGVADFTVAPDQCSMSKQFWTSVFESDYVFLNAEHLPTLEQEFVKLESAYAYGGLPYHPYFLKPAYYHFVGRKSC